MKPKQLQNIFHMIAIANPIVQHVIQIKKWRKENINVNVKIIVHEKKIIVGTLAHAFLRTASI